MNVSNKTDRHKLERTIMNNEITTVANYSDMILAAFDARAEYERVKNPENDNIQGTLKAMRKTCERTLIAELMQTCSVDAQFINKSERTSNRFNVYAAEKVCNIAQASLKVAALNHYTRAILASAIALEKSELVLTHDDAQSACSLSVKAKDAKREKLIVKYQKHVAKSTASTQSSSSIAALMQFDVLRETRDASNVACYKLNSEAEAFKLLSASL